MKVKVGYITYDVKFIKKWVDGELHGKCDNSAHKIKIYEGGPQNEIANTIIHEILHAGWYSYGIGLSDKEEERIVSALANCITDVVKNNPRLIKKIGKMLKTKR